VHLAAPYLHAAFALLHGSRGVVLDLRRNGGGDPGTVTLVLDWLLGDRPTHVSDVIYRDRTRQWWTTGPLGQLALPAGTPVAVLISGRTFSSGEALAYHVQSHGRARLVGERTPGAADHITPVRVTSDVRAFVPEAVVRDAITGSNWAGTGVVPDVACDAAEALEAALEVLRSG
jgi:C-terminal processing protease CtpA/Prc